MDSFLSRRRRQPVVGGWLLACSLLIVQLGCGSSPAGPSGSGGAGGFGAGGVSGGSGGKGGGGGGGGNAGAHGSAGAGSSAGAGGAAGQTGGAAGQAGGAAGAGNKGGAGGAAGQAGGGGTQPPKDAGASDGGVDAACNNVCTTLGATECAANSTIATCADQTATCRSWQASMPCGTSLACQRLGGPICFDPNWAAWPMPNDAADVAQGAPNPTHYTDNGDGTITDDVTGLMWQKTLPITSPPPYWRWADGLLYCQGLRLAGFDNWRLPSAIELLSIVDYGHANPAIDQTVFPNTPALTFWTSTTTASAAGSFWVVLFEDGRAIPQDEFGQQYSYARCVR